MNKITGKTIGFILLILTLLSFSLFGIKQIIFIFVTRTDYSDHMASMAAMVILTGLILIISKKRKVSLSIFPAKFTPFYLCASIAAAILLIASPSNFTGGIKTISLLLYGSIVTPIFEELIFRGYIWTKLNTVFSKEWVTYLISTVLFGLWHLGYVSSLALRVGDGLLTAMIWKVITGLCFGIILGAVRLKTKNCYSTMLLHGILNLFGR